MVRSLDIFHIASFARSGETMLLRDLSMHPELYCVVNLHLQDTKTNLGLFEHLKQREQTNIPCHDPLVAPLVKQETKALLLKQGVWEHRFMFHGIVLVRNPLSVYWSLINYDPWAERHGLVPFKLGKRWPVPVHRRPHTIRLYNWCRAIDADLAKTLKWLDPLEQFAALYNRRMLHLATLGLAIVHYEKYVRNPTAHLRAIWRLAGVSVLAQAEPVPAGFFKHNKVGHGKNDLSRPTSTGSLEKYRSMPRRDFERVKALTMPSWRSFGYRIGRDTIEVEDNVRGQIELEG